MSIPRCMSVLALGLVLAGLAGCSSIDARTTQYVGAPHPSPTAAATVEVLRSEPTRPHVRLGEIVVDASVSPPPPITDVEQKLREQAASIGGDAVVVVYPGPGMAAPALQAAQATVEQPVRPVLAVRVQAAQDAAPRHYPGLV